jgi:hypothetical protein
MQFPPTCRHFIPFRSKYSPQRSEYDDNRISRHSLNCFSYKTRCDKPVICTEGNSFHPNLTPHSASVALFHYVGGVGGRYVHFFVSLVFCFILCNIPPFVVTANSHLEAEMSCRIVTLPATLQANACIDFCSRQRHFLKKRQWECQSGWILLNVNNLISL